MILAGTWMRSTGSPGRPQARQQPRRRHAPDFVTGMVHDGNGRAQGIGHGEVTERDQGDVRAPGGVQGRHDAERRPRGGAQDGSRGVGAAHHDRHPPRAAAWLVALSQLTRRSSALHPVVQQGRRGSRAAGRLTSRMAGRVTHVGDPPVPVTDEMSRGIERGPGSRRSRRGPRKGRVPGGRRARRAPAWCRARSGHRRFGESRSPAIRRCIMRPMTSRSHSGSRRVLVTSTDRP